MGFLKSEVMKFQGVQSNTKPNDKYFILSENCSFRHNFIFPSGEQSSHRKVEIADRGAIQKGFFLINSVSFIFINLSLLIQRAVAIVKYFFTLFFLSNFWKDRIEDLASSCLSTPSVRKIRASFFQVTHFLCAPAPLGNFQLDQGGPRH